MTIEKTRLLKPDNGSGIPLKNKTDLATVTFSLVERKGYVPPLKPSFITQVQQTFNSSWLLLMEVGQKLALIAVAVSPWLAAALIVVIPGYLIIRLLRWFR